MIIKYHKLVRDKIPQIIRDGGSTCKCSVLSHEDYLVMLDQKLLEELSEYQESKNLEELADLLEVIHAVAKARGSSFEKIDEIRKQKANERGGFRERILLEEVDQSL